MFRNSGRPQRSSSSRFGGSGRGGRGGGKRGFGNAQTVSPHVLLARAQQKPTEEQAAAPVEIKHEFADFKLVQPLKDNIAAKGYVTPTPIQDQVIPLVLEGNDVIGLANTGTGKTAAFSLPIINYLYHNRDQKVLIMAPTRELALQIRDEIRSFSNGLKLYSTLCIGGANIRVQINDLRRNPHIIIGTPGRLKDLYDRGELDFGDFATVVLDEVDRMLDMGFIHDITWIMQRTPEDRQTLFFSATMDRNADQLAQQFLKNPIRISVKTRETAANVEQEFVRVFSPVEKMRHLNELLAQEKDSKLVIFGRTQHGVEKLSQTLENSGYNVGSMHGRKTQPARERTLKQFRRNEIRILVATDVAARGLDIDDITHVVNYELPATYEDYVHRIGRTGRAARAGRAITYIDQK